MISCARYSIHLRKLHTNVCTPQTEFVSDYSPYVICTRYLFTSNPLYQCQFQASHFQLCANIRAQRVDMCVGACALVCVFVCVCVWCVWCTFITVFNIFNSFSQYVKKALRKLNTFSIIIPFTLDPFAAAAAVTGAVFPCSYPPIR